MSRAPNYEFQEWWNKQREKENLDLFEDKSDQSSSPFIAVDVSGNGGAGGSHNNNRSDPSVRKERTRSARQLSWVCLLKFQQIASTVGFLSNGLIYLVRTANRRIVSRDSPADSSSRLYRAIRVFLIVVIALLGFELVAYFKGWHFRPPVGSADVLGLVGVFYARWIDIRANYLAPPLQLLTNMCILLFIVQSVDRIVLILGCFWIKFRRIRPVASVDYDKNVERVEDYPMVLVQIPMCNEREVRTCRFLSPFQTYFCLNAGVYY